MNGVDIVNHKTEESNILKVCDSYVSRIILNAPKSGNVIAEENMELFLQYFKEAVESDTCRVIVIEGREGVFCRGLDFNYIVKDANISNADTFANLYKNILKLIYYSPKPVIAAIDGEVLAGGMGLILAADIVIATERSTFCLSEVLFGLIPALIFPFLLERVSFKTARFLVLSSSKIDACKADRIGVVDEVIKDGDLEKELKQHLKRLLFSSPDALALTKRYSDKLQNINLDSKLEHAQKTLAQLLKNKDNIKAINSFLDGGHPDWVISYKTGVKTNE